MKSNLGNKEIMAQNIRYYMEEKGIQSKDMCDVLDVPSSTFSYWINAKTYPRIDKIEKMANFFGITKADLVEERSNSKDTQKIYTGDRDIDPIYDALNEAGQQDLCRYGRYLTTLEEYRKPDEEPVIKMIQFFLTPAAAGYASPVDGSDYEMIPLPDGAPNGADFCIKIDGDSMEPYIKDGEMVYVKRGAPLQEFDVGIFFVGGDVYCKQYCPGYGGQLYLLSANPKRQDANVILMPEDARGCTCFGKVMLKHRLPKPMYM